MVKRCFTFVPNDISCCPKLTYVKAKTKYILAKLNKAKLH